MVVSFFCFLMELGQRVCVCVCVHVYIYIYIYVCD